MTFVDLQQDWAAWVAVRLAADGFARFDRIRDRAQLVTLGASLGRIVPHRDSDDDGVTTLENRGGLARRLGYEGFGTGALAPHTDRSGVIDPPALLLVVCGRKSSTGGDSLAIDGRSVRRSPDDRTSCCTSPFSTAYGAVRGVRPDTSARCSSMPGQVGFECVTGPMDW
jgi:hypothetical protein